MRNRGATIDKANKALAARRACKPVVRIDYGKLVAWLNTQRGKPRPFLNITVAEEVKLATYLLRNKALVATMQQPPVCDRDGRAVQSRDARVVSVNGTEVRVSSRWASHGKASLLAAGKDFECYTVKPDGSREPFTPYRDVDEAVAKSRSRVEHGASYFDRVAAFGANTELAAE